MPTLGDVTALLDEWYPPGTADDWDAVGLVCGDPAADVRRILLAVDPVTAVADEAIEAGAQLLVTHHPLFLKGVHGVAATDPKGRVVHRLLGAGCGLFTAHTNADAPAGGVSESLALALGLVDPRPLEPPAPGDGQARRLRARWRRPSGSVPPSSRREPGTIGDYDSASFTSAGEGRFRPLDGARPAIGTVGEVETVDEVRIEVVAATGAARPRARRRCGRPIPTRSPPTTSSSSPPRTTPARGSGRIGLLAEPVTLREFAASVAAVLPVTAHGVRVAGDPDQRVADRRPVRRGR